METTLKENKMNIDYGLILTKAATRQKAIADFAKALDSLDAIMIHLAHARDSLSTLDDLHSKIDDEGRTIFALAVGQNVVNQISAIRILKQKLTETIDPQYTCGVGRLVEALKQRKES